jgi:hypothetical protein
MKRIQASEIVCLFLPFEIQSQYLRGLERGTRVDQMVHIKKYEYSYSTGKDAERYVRHRVHFRRTRSNSGSTPELPRQQK